MKSLRRISLAALASAAALFIAGCGHKDTEGHEHANRSGDAAHAHDPEAGVSFNAKKGLFVPPATAKFIGLQIADVEQQKIASAFQFSAQVYRAAREGRFASLQPGGAPAALASGNVSPADADRLNEGQMVSVQNAEGGVALPGRIVALRRALEQASGQVEVLLSVSDAEMVLPTGAFISVTVPLGGGQNVVSVPRSALLRTAEDHFVYTVSGEHFVRTRVKLGAVNDKFAEVTDGLYAGDQIVVQPVMSLWMAELQSIRGGQACADGH